jgi:hypothetical protein
MEKVVFVNGVKNLTVGNAEGHYTLACNADLDSCVTPTPGKDYLVFNEASKWRMPGANEDITLKWLQDWTVTYNKGENIALVPAGGGDPNTVGMYWLVRWDARWVAES